MANPKLFVSAGCSFSSVPPDNWPLHLANYLGCESQFLGQGAGDNGTISRKTLYHLNEALKQYQGNEILLGIMWSGHERYSFFFDKLSTEYTKIWYGIANKQYMNPLALDLPNTDMKYYLVHHIWDDELSKTYYKNFYNEINHIIITFEHILRIQLFCEKYNIKYFFSRYNGDTMPTSIHEAQYKYHINFKEIKHFYELVDWSNWLPIGHAWEWFLNESGYPEDERLGNHPSTEQSKALVDKVIIPFLKNKGYID